MPKQHASDQAENAGPGISWQPPPPRFVTDPRGRRRPVYECAACRDVGLITLPGYRPDETDEDLLHPPADGKRYASFCSDCRGVGRSTTIASPDTTSAAHPAHHEDMTDRQLARLGRWSRARRAELEAERREDAPSRVEAFATVREAVRNAAKEIPGGESQRKAKGAEDG
jgi:hypothetical protein